ncbi:threonine synthase [Ekhidna sp.]|uniref:threonine synthase n=1 Tax=Ekhidna sp. TaxID=2608089 RepID=UPI003299277F
MKFYSTNNKLEKVSFREAVLKSLPEDNGLFFPEKIPVFDQSFIKKINSLSLNEIAFHVLSPFCTLDIPRGMLEQIIADTFVFDIPVVQVEDKVNCLELFHGPTMAFKDVGARFLARVLSSFKEYDDQETTILVATSGDTGGAVASGFYNQPGINVVILYPKGKVTPLQERQMTTLGGNIRAFEVAGDFDDCQSMVKQAFLDTELKDQNLSSANSINVARWLPQSVYYYVPFMSRGFVENLVFSVPSGNFGNVTSGMLAKTMGLPIRRFIASTNVNDVVPRYLKDGKYQPRETITTISNAMDVSKPSNISRLQELHSNSFESITKETTGFVLNDHDTRTIMRQCYDHNKYVLDPHTAIAYAGLKSGLQEAEEGFFIGTAHHSKFLDVVNSALGTTIDLPEKTSYLFEKDKESTNISSDYQAFKDLLMA